jgi:hypothetical protein
MSEKPGPVKTVKTVEALNCALIIYGRIVEEAHGQILSM